MTDKLVELFEEGGVPDYKRNLPSPSARRKHM